MSSRFNDLLSIRPEILSAKVHEGTSAEEAFQNKTLRPIIKLQHDLFIAVFKNYIRKHKNVFLSLILDEQLKYISNAIQKDIKFRNALKGMVIGQFTVKEYEIYIKNSSALNKRITNIIKERLIHSIQLFNQPELQEI
ncbi:glyoxalase [uncultured Winogradskyella sp.]|mgnify:FL=1|uniref:glyoxalase n=1 Tax=uncultured Winogradskyella sp. TaxID=395353 RepID=UPI0030EB4D02|tara:strand:+ start:409 stop:822 length:414 start_codon:yes stop_codon:yes gene_type:complete